jgi:hypothetical protein
VPRRSRPHPTTINTVGAKPVHARCPLTELPAGVADDAASAVESPAAVVDDVDDAAVAAAAPAVGGALGAGAGAGWQDPWHAVAATFGSLNGSSNWSAVAWPRSVVTMIWHDGPSLGLPPPQWVNPSAGSG